MPERGTSTGRFLIEFDGITAIRATECRGMGVEHMNFELFESNRPNPRLGRGHYKINEITVKHATALNNTGDEVWQWFIEFVKGSNVERRTFRLIKLDEDGESPIETWECFECIPTKFENDNSQAGGNDAAYFNFSIKPDDMEFIGG